MTLEDYTSETIFFTSPIGTLIAKLTKMMNKNSSSDTDLEFDKSLEQFINQINETDQYLSHGIFNIKFAEAGLFLQSAATVYGQKVDTLWENTLKYQMKLCSYARSPEEQSEETTVIKERLNRNKRKKLILQEKNDSSPLYNDLNLMCETADKFLKEKCSSIKEERLNLNDEIAQIANDDIVADITNQPFTTHCTAIIQKLKLPLSCPIHNIQSGEKVCNYDDIYLNCCNPYPEILSTCEIQPNALSKSYLIRSSTNDWLLQKYVSNKRLSYKTLWANLLGGEFESYRGQMQFTNHLPIASRRLSNNDQVDNLSSNESVIKIPPLPYQLISECEKMYSDPTLNKGKHGSESCNNINQNKKGSERISDADSLFHDGPFEDEDETSANIYDHTLSTQRSSADSGIFCSELMNLSGPEEIGEENSEDDMTLTVATEPISNSSTKESQVEVQAQSNEEANIELKSKSNDEKNANIDKSLSKSSLISSPITVVHKTVLKPDINTADANKISKRKLDKSERSKEELESARKRRRTVKLIRRATAPLDQFECFFRRNYQPEFGEGEISDWGDDSPRLVMDQEDLNAEECGAFEITSLSQESIHLHNTPLTPTEFCESNIDELFNGNQEIGIPVCESTPTICDNIDSHDLTSCDTPLPNPTTQVAERLKPVSEWKTFIEPKLAQLEEAEKRSFNIHDYGTQIMDAIPTSKNLHFGELVEGKSPAEVTRFFLASLQLANTYNVELIAPQKGVIVNDMLELKLLTRERYHEHLEEYEAPSENTYWKKLAEVKALQSSQSLQSTPRRHLAHKFKKRKII